MTGVGTDRRVVDGVAMAWVRLDSDEHADAESAAARVADPEGNEVVIVSGA